MSETLHLKKKKNHSLADSLILCVGIRGMFFIKPSPGKSQNLIFLSELYSKFWDLFFKKEQSSEFSQCYPQLLLEVIANFLVISETYISFYSI